MWLRERSVDRLRVLEWLWPPAPVVGRQWRLSCHSAQTSASEVCPARARAARAPLPSSVYLSSGVRSGATRAAISAVGSDPASYAGRDRSPAACLARRMGWLRHGTGVLGSRQSSFSACGWQINVHTNRMTRGDRVNHRTVTHHTLSQPCSEEKQAARAALLRKSEFCAVGF